MYFLMRALTGVLKNIRLTEFFKLTDVLASPLFLKSTNLLFTNLLAY